jgi:tetratricopeptide (TPR) repeat protein
MTEALTTELAKIGALRVISRTSSMQYKGANKPVAEIARELGVDAVVEGSVSRAGDRVRITAQLIRAATDEHLWAEGYERDVRDVLALQDEVARAIAGQIKVKLTPSEQAQLAAARPVNAAAHDLYLKGLYVFNEGRNHPTPGQRSALLRRSFEYYEQAIAIDPNDALAHAGLARAYHWLASIGYPEYYPKAKAEALEAIRLDDNLAEAHAALAFSTMQADWDWAGAEREYRRALELNPNYSEAHHGYALYLTQLGRKDDAIAEIERAEELDPLTVAVRYSVGNVYVRVREYDRAITQFRENLDLDPSQFGSRLGLALALARTGRYDEAIREAQKAGEPSDDEPRSKALLAWIYAASGRRSEALRAVDGLAKFTTEDPSLFVDIAAVYAEIGERETALAFLTRAVEAHAPGCLSLKIHPSFDQLRSDPRYQRLLGRVGFPA